MARIVIVAGTDAGQEVADALTSAGHAVTRSQTVAEAAGADAPQVLFVECWLAGTGAMPADVPVVLIAPADALSAAVDSVLKGAAHDLLRTPCTADEIRIVARRALRHQELLNENAELRLQLEPAGDRESAASNHEDAADDQRDARVPVGLEAARTLAGKPLADIEKQVILSTLEQFKGHRLRTAHALGIGVRTLGMKIKRWREEGEPIAGRQPRPPVHVDVS